MLAGPVADRLAELLRENAARLSVEIEGLEVMSDHVHLVVSAPPTLAPQFLANQVKGAISRVLRQEFPALRRRLPPLRSRSYYVGSAGHVASETTEGYIVAQKRS